MRFLSLALAFALVSCNVAQKPAEVSSPSVPESKVETTSPAQEPKPEVVVQPSEVVQDLSQVPELSHEASKPIGPEYPVANAKKVFTVKIKALNYTAKQMAKLNRAMVLIALIANSQEYKNEVHGYMYKGAFQFVDNNGLTNPQVYEKLFAGAEALQPAVNYQMDLTVQMYTKKFSNVVGWTNPSIMIVHTNSKYHNNYSACQVSSNLFHEWTHKMGFGHDFDSTPRRPYSVPYAHNRFIEKLCPLAEAGKLTPL